MEDTNIKFSVVLTDVFGLSGRRIIEAILENEAYQSVELLPLIDRRVRVDQAEIVKALEGRLDKA